MNNDAGSHRSWRIVVAVVGLLAAVLVVVAIVAQPANRAHDRLTQRHLEISTFPPAPPRASFGETVGHIWADLKQQSLDGRSFFKSILPTESGAIWISILVAVTVGLDTAEVLNPLNLELLSTLLVGVFMFNIMRFFDFLEDPTYFNVMDWVFTAIVVVTLGLFARALWRVWSAPTHRWRPNLPARTLMLLTLILLTLNALTVVIREPDDAGFYTNLGGQRLRERARFPYGDQLITGSAAAAYGPVLFLAHLPFQFLLDPSPVNPVSQNHALLPGDVYRLPAPLATELATLTFHLLGVGALIVATRRLAGDQVAWGLAALYCGSAYVLGVGGPREMIGGLTFISHMAAPSLALTAFALLDSPLLAGVMLALSVATVFYPLFFIPAWIGYYWNDRKRLLRFVGGLALAAVVVGGPVLALSRSNPGEGRLSTIVKETLGHHQSTAAYGEHLFGFWGGRGGVRGWLQHELVPGQAASTPVFLVVLAFAAWAFVPARGATRQQLALLSAACAMLAVTWKILGTGVYVTWYFPFLLIGFFASGPPSIAVAPSHRPEAASASTISW
jgi:hypothetical protein